MAKQWYCTMIRGAELCKIPGKHGSNWKWPSLAELYQHLFHATPANQHQASGDVLAACKCFLQMNRLGFGPGSVAHCKD